MCLLFDFGLEGYGMGEFDLIIRKELFGGCVSIMEVVVCVFVVFEFDGYIFEDKFMNVLCKMVLL